MPNEQFSSFIMTRTSSISMRGCWCPLGTRSARLVEFYSASSLKQEYAGRHARSTRTHYSDSKPTSFLLFLLNVVCSVQK